MHIHSLSTACIKQKVGNEIHGFSGLHHHVQTQLGPVESEIPE